MPPLERTQVIEPPEDGDDEEESAPTPPPPPPRSAATLSGPELTRSRSYRGDAEATGRNNDNEEDGDELDDEESPPTFRGKAHRILRRFIRWCGESLNFYRIHLLFFTITPIIAAAFMYAWDESNNDFANHLTLAVSAMTVTGLNPILMQDIATWQQAIAFFLSCIGSTTGVSLITILIRRHFFRKRFESLVKSDARIRKRVQDVESRQEGKRFHNVLNPFALSEKNGSNLPTMGSPGNTRPVPAAQANKKRKRTKLSTSMIRRIDEPVRVNQMNVGGFLSDQPGSPRRPSRELSGQMSEMQAAALGLDGIQPRRSSSDEKREGRFQQEQENEPIRTESPEQLPERDLALQGTPRSRFISIEEPDALIRQRRRTTADDSDPDATEEDEDESEGDSDDDTTTARHRGSPAGRSRVSIQSRDRRMSDSVADVGRPRAASLSRNIKRVRTLEPGPVSKLSPAPNTSTFPRTQTIDIREPDRPVHRGGAHSTAIPHIGAGLGDGMRRRTTGVALERTASRRVGVEAVKGNTGDFPRTVTRQTAMTQGFGGFPNPVKFVATAARDRILAKTATLDVPRTNTLQSVHSERGLDNISGGPTRAVSYITFDATVGRNSYFYSLTAAQRDELGGVEYRALSALLKIVAAYYVLVQLIPIIIFAPVMKTLYAWQFADVGSVTNSGGWYAAFNIVSAYSNSGLSLLDTSMITFQTAYSWILVLGFCILAGNTAFPVFLRFSIWVLSKLVPKTSRLHETLQFLLDHPRRCYIYLFPSHQTWLLLGMLVILNCTDWVCFLVLDIGNATLDALGVGTRMIDGLLQSFAVRSAGFAIVPLAELAPAVKVLYVVMMYVAVYPVAISIRATNVYEERSMGVFHDEEDTDSQLEADFAKNHKAGSYFAHHARKQLAFDIWWLALALWAICIIERNEIDNPESDGYFTVFTIMFELVSAYGTVGLSLGVPYANFSLCGGFRTLSKLIVCAVMIRGRHRGLPVAIDRSILLPSDIEAMRNTRSLQRIGTNTMEDNQNNASAAEQYFGPHSDSRSNTGGGTLRKLHSRRPSVPEQAFKAPRSATFDASRTRQPSVDVTAATDDRSRSASEPKPHGLNGYLSTIYSEQPSRATTPAGTEHDVLGAQSSSQGSSEGDPKAEIAR